MIKPLGVNFAIRGAGMQPLPGSANVQGGVTLDLRRFIGIDIMNGFVQGGTDELWGKVYEKLDAFGLSVTGSRSAIGGIGGRALQGGLSFFSSSEGFICDNILSFEVVLASGEIINANASDNEDLWRALKGVGNNQGIVTRFDIWTFKQGLIWGGTVFYFPSSFPSQLESLVKELHKPNTSKETHLMLSIGYSFLMGNSIMCLNQLYCTQVFENPPELDPFTKVQPQIDALNIMRLHSVKDAAAEQSASGQAQVRCAYMNITVKADLGTLNAVSEIYTAELKPLKGFENVTLSLTLQPYPVSLMEQSTELRGNSLGLGATEGPLVSILLLSCWESEEYDNAVLEIMKDALDKIKVDATERNQLVPFIYMNYAFRH
ncbi:hypothetical protein F5Y00DRAFT_256502 [Daldinia vernicosa]|uniref:uncharacterized protein n=1 Tax=Daldinia vernicosa TaxID=114800 RepID=UPI002008E74D|nr:uncharacterized protein F5Y00DRAFT_256502 [Daldinia vernicosa]KAI0843845.1 hypothetical protein F5Y00DRAFT_256502 [Daldinia vernicosa]